MRAPVTILISICLGLFAVAQTPAAAATSRIQAWQTVTHNPAKAPEPKAALSGSPTEPAPQSSDYEPAGCYNPTPQSGRASCFAMVRVSGHRMMTNAAGPPAGVLTPADIQSAYRLPATGQGQTVAVVDAYGYSTAEADLAVFRHQYGLPACTSQSGCFRKVDQQGGTNYPPDDSDWSTEVALDLDAVSSACPACNILLVEANSNALSDLSASVDTAVALGAKFVSNSYGAPDALVAGQASDAHYNHPGVVVTASAGDVGNAIEWPSSDPNVVAVGGTTLTAAPGTTRGWTESAWSRGGSGCSSFEPQPVYQSELATDCTKRATADISADADPNSGLAEYDSLNGGWAQVGGTSLASPLIASMYALAGTPATGTYPVTYPYIHTGSDLSDVTAGTNGGCGTVLCTAGPGWDGPTGLGTPNGVAALAMGPQGTVAGRVTDRASGAPLAGAPVVLTDAADRLTFRAITDATGSYQVSVSAGTYEISVSVFGYGTDVISGVAVATGTSTTADAALTKTPVRTVTGKVTDSGHRWPLYAKITIDGDPNGPVYTDPTTGTYSMALPEQADYTMHVTPDYPGYTPSATTVALKASDLRHDVSVTHDPTQCTAPGYAYRTQADFSGWTTAPRYGWTVTDNGTSAKGWQFDDPGGQGSLTGGTGSFATADPQDNSGTAEDTDLTSPEFSLVGQTSADLKFNAAAAFATGSEADASVTTDGGQTWKMVYQAGDNVRRPVDIPLTQALGHPDVHIRFHFSGQDQSLFQLSNVSVGQCQRLGGGLIEGEVGDANTHQPLGGATVTDSSAPVTDPYATSVTAAHPDDAHLPGGFYWLYSPNAGPNTVTTTAPRYTTVSTAVVASNAVHTYSPDMRAGRLQVTPTEVALTAALGSKASQDVALTNTGTAPLKVTVYEQNARSSATTRTGAADGPWQSLTDYPQPVEDNVVGSYEGRTYSVGGTMNVFGGAMLGQAVLVKHNYVYDPVAASWSRIADLPQLRTAATGAFLDGTLYVVGGLDYPPRGGSGILESTTYAYHPSSDSWSQVANLPQAVDYASAAVLDGELYVIGGQTAAGSSAAAYRYDPAGNTWTRIADYPVGMDSGGCGGIVGGIACAGGESEKNGNTTLLASTYVYHPQTNTWTRAADMPYNDFLGSYSAANGELQVVGGWTIPDVGAGGPTDRAVQYDPVADVWTGLPDAPGAADRAGRGTGCGLSLVGGAMGPMPFGTTGVKTLPGFDQCGGDDVNWLAESSTTVDLAPGQSTRIQVTADTSALSAPGGYAATLSMITNSPYLNRPVPVTLQATAPAPRAQLSGTVTDAVTGKALPGAEIAVSHTGGHRLTVTTDSHGQDDVRAKSAMPTITAGDARHTGTGREVTTTRAGRDTKTDLSLPTA
jgi:N-acetylneuraminic acid mutarotase